MSVQVFNKEKAQQRRKEVQVCLPTSHALRLSAMRISSIQPMFSCSRSLKANVTVCYFPVIAWCPRHLLNQPCVQEEMKRGYFDDFKDLKETQGRMIKPSEALSPASTSPQLPTIAVSLVPCSVYRQWLCLVHMPSALSFYSCDSDAYEKHA